jgi:hypothetical protein
VFTSTVVVKFSSDKEAFAIVKTHCRLDDVEQGRLALTSVHLYRTGLITQASVVAIMSPYLS